jgi:hypothetical protein
MERLPDILAGLAALAALIPAINSVRLWLRFRRFIRDARAEPLSAYTPRAAVVIPCKGVDKELAAGLRTLLAQDYPAYEMMFVVESADDPAAAVIRSVLDSTPRAPGLTRAELVFAGRADDCGQKVHNLRAGLARVSADAEVFAFVDSDCLPHPLWLRRLVAPLADPAVGAATGYRWYLPVRRGVASALLSLWNANTAVLLANPATAHVWGGSMAVRREVFDSTQILECWKGSLSDDLGVYGAVARAGLAIAFTPQCLVPSEADTTWPKLWEFVCRQLIIGRVYAPGYWRRALAAVLPIVPGLAALPTALLLPAPPEPALRIAVIAVGAAVWLAALVQGFLRLGATKAAFPDWSAGRRRVRLMYLLGAPLFALFQLACLIKARRCRTIVWRGIKYVMHDRRRLTVVRPEPDASGGGP